MYISFILIGLLIYQSIIEINIPSFGYSDEITILVLLIIILYNLLIQKRHIKLYKLEKVAILFLFIYFLWGIFLSNKYSIQNEFMDAIISGILTLKSFLIYFFARIAFSRIKVENRKLDKVYKFNKFIINLNFILVIFNIPFKYLKTYDVKFGYLNTITLGFKHPSELEFLCVTLMIIQLFITVILNKKMKRYYMMCLKIIPVIIFTGRVKVLIFFILLIVMLSISEYFKKFKIKYLIYISPLMIYLGIDKIKNEVVSTTHPRGILYNTAIKIANDFFPFGSGFGTFGTEISRIKYSNLYYYYGISNQYGFSQQYSSYLTDTQWASIIAETGYVGVFIFGGVLIALTFLFFFISNDYKIRVALSSFWIYALITSIGDPIFMIYRGVVIMLITALFIKIAQENSLKNIGEKI